MKVCVNPAHRVGDRPIRVLDPLTGQPFPDGAFELPEARLNHPAILRLFPKPGEPGGLPGGCHGDLIPAEPPASETPPRPARAAVKERKS